MDVWNFFERRKILYSALEKMKTYNVVILLQSHFLLLHLWMGFFNEAEYREASNVHQCGMMKS